MSWQILEGDCRDVLATLPAQSVHTCVTSPPYFGLRDYGTGEWEGGDPACDHSPERRGGRFATPVSGKQASNVGSGTASSRDCLCGATRVDRQIGLEPTPDEFAAALVEVFREVRRVLRDDGTVWLNLGDSYARPDGTSRQSGRLAVGLRERQFGEGNAFGKAVDAGVASDMHKPSFGGAKPKDLIGIPWMVAFALRADGWYLRSEIIWAKPNPMPESVSDRPTKAHEQLFLLSKSPRYVYDADAIREPHAPGSIERMEAGFKDRYADAASGGHRGAYGGPNGAQVNPAGRNKRSVWTVATQPYSGAHFATFPPKLIEPCVLAGSPVGGTVLDPFNGAGTTGLVAIRAGRSYIGIELNPEYADLARDRIATDVRLGHRSPQRAGEPIAGQVSMFDDKNAA